jgi:hypothetical protein
MSIPGFDAGSLYRKLEAAGLLKAFEEAVHTLDVTRVLEILREAKLPDEEVKRAAAAILVESSLRED